MLGLPGRAPFHVRDVDVWLLDRFLLDCFPGHQSLAQALLNIRLFRVPPDAPPPGGFLVRCITGFEWDLPLAQAEGTTHTLVVAIVPPDPAVGAVAAFAGWWKVGEGGLPARFLRPPEEFRMSYRHLIPTYNRRYLYECYKREAARRGMT
jgi:hypothetical protein